MITIRAAEPDDGAVLREIERLAGQRFREVGLAAVADAEPLSTDELAEYARAGRSWVAVTIASEVVGFALAAHVDGDAHLDQVSVLPAHQGRGIGRLLVDRVNTWAREQGLDAVTLTTYADVAWNGPLYEHLGFRVLDDAEVGPELARIRATERASGLDVMTRVCMWRPVPIR